MVRFDTFAGRRTLSRSLPMHPSPKRTPLSDLHESRGARMVEFGGWWMPVQYDGIIQEHHAVRKFAGLFDISHMGEIFISGQGAAAFLNGILTNDINRLRVGNGQYTLLLNPAGGVIDDLLCYRIEGERFLLVVNASMIDHVVDWIFSQNHDHVFIENGSSKWAGIAIQGPQSESIISRALSPSNPLPDRNQIASFKFQEGPLFVARTGYTGEDGFELFCPSPAAAPLWQQLLSVGEPLGLACCGLGCRDTLRLEMGFPLNGSDLSPERTPLEAGLGAFVRLEKGPFIGSEILSEQKARGTRVKLCGLVMEGKTPPPRPHYPVLYHGKVVGETCSGSLSPTLEIGIAMAYLPSEIASPGNHIEIDIRGRRFPAVTSKRPMYQPASLSELKKHEHSI